MKPPFKKLLPEKERAGIAEEIQDAGILKADRQKPIDSSQDRRDDDPRLGNGKDRKKDTHAYDGEVPKLPLLSLEQLTFIYLFLIF